MTCTYCGATNANSSLNGDCACFDCFTRLVHTPAAERQAKLLSDLQLNHATVLRLDPISKLRESWLEELTNRMAWARVAKFAPDPEVEGDGVEPAVDRSIENSVDPPPEVKRTGPLKIRRRA